MPLTAEEERKAEDKLTGIKPRSAKSLADDFILKFATMARKLRKGQEGKPDQYSPIIERMLGKYDAAIELLERYPQVAAEYGEGDQGIHDILEMLERKAAALEGDEMYNKAAEKVRKLEPGYRHNEMIRDAIKGGFVNRNLPSQVIRI